MLLFLLKTRPTGPAGPAGPAGPTGRSGRPLCGFDDVSFSVSCSSVCIVFHVLGCSVLSSSCLLLLLCSPASFFVSFVSPSLGSCCCSAVLMTFLFLFPSLLSVLCFMFLFVQCCPLLVSCFFFVLLLLSSFLLCLLLWVLVAFVCVRSSWSGLFSVCACN